MSWRFPLSVLVALAIGFVGELLYFYPQLPEIVAAHFDLTGVPNGWMSRTAFAATLLAVVIVSAAPTAGIALLLPRMESAINIPNKAYWLAPERRQETLGFIAASLIWTECAVIALVMVLTHGVCMMNIEGRKTLDLPVIPTLIMFLAFVAFIMGRMFLRFRTSNTSEPSY